MIRLVAIDVDDTLINHQLEISAANVEAIRAIMDKGIIVTLATGRMHRSAVPFARQLGMPEDQPIITYNGAMTRTLAGAMLNHIPIRADVVLDTVALAREGAWTLNLYHDDLLFVASMNSYVKDYEVLSGVPAQVVGPLDTFVQQGNDEVSKLLVIGEPEDTANRLEIIKDQLGSRAEVVRSRPHFIEITDREANKGVALARLAQQLGVSADEVLAIGDSGNDVAMFRFAGTSVAMGNAQAAVREQAAFVTGSNDESGVAQALRRFC